MIVLGVSLNAWLIALVNFVLALFNILVVFLIDLTETRTPGLHRLGTAHPRQEQYYVGQRQYVRTKLGRPPYA